MTRATSHQRELARISTALAGIGFALPGSLVRRSTRCGKAGCRCQADPAVAHGPYLSWTRAVNGKTINRAINPEQEHRYREWLDNHRKLRRPLSELEALSIRALEEAEGPQTSVDPQPPGCPLPNPHARTAGLAMSFPACPKMGQLHVEPPCSFLLMLGFARLGVHSVDTP